MRTLTAKILCHAICVCMQANTGEVLVDMFGFVMHTVKQYNPAGAIK